LKILEGGEFGCFAYLVGFLWSNGWVPRKFWAWNTARIFCHIVSSSSMLAPFIMNYLEPCLHCYPVKEWNKMKDICTCKNVRRHLCLKKWWSFGLIWPTCANSVFCLYVENKSIMLQTLRGVKSKIVTQFGEIEILLVPSDKLRPDGSFGSYTDFTLPI